MRQHEGSGPKGEKRPADPMQRAVMIGQIATGQIKDNKKSARHRSGLAGAKARTENAKSRAYAEKDSMETRTGLEPANQ